MNICLLTNSFLPKVGGMELAVHYLANALSARGCRVTVIAKYLKGPIQLPRSYTLIQSGNRFPFSGRTGADALAGIYTLLRTHLRERFDLINCHGVSYAGSQLYFARKSGLLNSPAVMTPHGEDVQMVPEVGYGLRLRPKWDRIIRRNLESADRITAISSSISKQLDFIAPEKISLIPNGIHLSEFRTGPTDFLHRYLGLPQNRKIVLSVGRNRHVKGYTYGVQAFESLLAQRPEAPLTYVIVGKNTHLLQPQIDRLGLSETVVTVPQMRREEIIKAYASAWCFLSPSLSEGLSLVSVEAMACGLPLVVTDVPGNADIIENNSCGLIVKAREPSELARGLIFLLEHPDQYEVFRQKALDRSPAYDWMKIAERYEQEYRRVLAFESGAYREKTDVSLNPTLD